jgi:outer membrane protein OmpA-like peptidoglycan-associated protein
MVPDKVLTAKQALDRAEAAHNEEPGSLEERNLAYLAHREAQLAHAYANISIAKKQRQRAVADYRTTQDELRRSARDELERIRRQLDQVRGEANAQGSVLSDRTKELAVREQELKRRMQELQTEKAARAKAEEAAAAAIASLERVAQVKEEARGTVITLSGAVMFQTGAATLLPVAERSLQAVADAIKTQSDETAIVVEGHTDSRGTNQMNMQLSKARAESVRAFLVGKGIDAKRITAVGKGEEQPITENMTPEGRANNRRVEIVLKPWSGG